MDPFQIRMDFSSQLRRLSASQQSIQKVLYTMSKHASRASDDLWDCIVREASKASLNARLNILFLIDALVTGADNAVSLDVSGGAAGGGGGGSSSSSSGLSPLVLAAFRPLITRDLVNLIDNIVPLTPDGVRLNLASTRAVVSSWRTGSILSAHVLNHILDRLEAKREQIKNLPPAEQQSETDFSRTEVLQRIEEDRERQKRLRERSWILPPKTYVNAIPHPPSASSSSSAAPGAGIPSSSSSTSTNPNNTSTRPSSSNIPTSSSLNALTTGSSSSSSIANPTATAASSSSATTSTAKPLRKGAKLTPANNAALTRDPLAALYGDTGPTSSNATSSSAPSTSGRKSAPGGGAGTITPAKRKANGTLITPSTSSSSIMTPSTIPVSTGTGTDSSIPIIIEDNPPLAQGQSSTSTTPLIIIPPSDALQIEMEEMWEITSDLNEDDFEAFAEEDGVGVGLAGLESQGGGSSVKAEKNGLHADASQGDAKAGGVTILGVASHNGPHASPTTATAASVPAPIVLPPQTDLVPRWWGSRAVFVQKYQSRHTQHHQQHQQQPLVRNQR
ncbi:hypothetical protein A4X13_0g5599 [Tilletia indica]|uniref:Uncharacterized protein n=1 Tax=Tilletia indica TaxID=43049 RepID=A0A177TFZ0_9BASI|nr:hypothetical protein A4X13_0g5599 [Tilletia indica]